MTPRKDKQIAKDIESQEVTEGEIVAETMEEVPTSTLSNILDKLARMDTRMEAMEIGMEANRKETIAGLLEVKGDNLEKKEDIRRSVKPSDGKGLLSPPTREGRSATIAPALQGDDAEFDEDEGEEHYQGGCRAQNRDRFPPRRQGGLDDRMPTWKLECPMFNGKNTMDWLYKVEMYFQCLGVPPEYQLTYVMLLFEEPALKWYQNITHRNPNLGWADFRAAMMPRFEDSRFADFNLQLKSLTQTGSVIDYQDQFESLMCLVTGWEDEALVGAFIGGLQLEIQLSVLGQPSRELQECMCVARHKEDKMRRKLEIRKSYKEVQREKKRYGKPPSPRAIKPAPGKTHEGRPPFQDKVPIRYISKAERDDLIRRGLCIKCKEKWEPKHVCRTFQLVVVLEEAGEGSTTENPSGEVEEEAVQEQPGSPSGECHTITNPSRPRYMRMVGAIQSKGVIVLLDSGASHNYIRTEGPDQGTSWEEFDQIAHRFPYARAWGQAQTQRGGSDTGLLRSPSRQDTGDAERRRATPAKHRGSGEARSLPPRGRARTVDEVVIPESVASVGPDLGEGGTRVPSRTSHTSAEGRQRWPLTVEGGADGRETADVVGASSRADAVPTGRAGKEPMVDPRLDLSVANFSCDRVEEELGPSGTKELANALGVGQEQKEDDPDSAACEMKTTLLTSG
ncbi:hypothetical protein EJ110_NYTH14996 [Nymphaea thermarum]|nr:hypothetical protein EJ110_NYTH14996 [Nymphaea thermarum]